MKRHLPASWNDAIGDESRRLFEQRQIAERLGEGAEAVLLVIAEVGPPALAARGPVVAGGDGHDVIDLEPRRVVDAGQAPQHVPRVRQIAVHQR